MTSPKEAAEALAARYGLTVTDGKTPFTELGNAERFVDSHKREIHYCWPWKKWLTWVGTHWSPNSNGEIYRRATGTIRDLYEYGGHLASQAADLALSPEEVKQFSDQSIAVQKWARQSESRKNIEAMVVLAQSRDAIPITPHQLDSDPWLLNCRNGTVNLKTGALTPHDPAQLITKMAAVDYDPAAECPIWESFLNRIMGENIELVDFLQRAMGYSLTGRTSTHVIFVAYGTGRNGKSTFLDTFLDLLGPYAKKAPPELLMLKKGDSHPTERAVLHGARFVPAIETAQGRKLNEAAVKEMTGGDQISTRRMREDFWEFVPTHKLWLATNHKPVISGTDIGIWSRIRLIPFAVTIPAAERDEELADKLKGEFPGILAWAVRGCIDWQENGLQEPLAVRTATVEYRNDMDVLGDFIDDVCIAIPGGTEKAGGLYDAYNSWAKDAGERVMSKKAFGQSLELRGFDRKRGTGGTRIWWGIHLKNNVDPAISAQFLDENGDASLASLNDELVTGVTREPLFEYKAPRTPTSCPANPKSTPLTSLSSLDDVETRHYLDENEPIEEKEEKDPWEN